MVSCDIVISLYAAPDPPVIISTHPNPVRQRTTIALTCTSALEGATFSWTLGSGPLPQGVVANGGTVMIPVTSDSTYTCTARSPDNGVMVSADYMITVEPLSSYGHVHVCECTHSVSSSTTYTHTHTQ